MKATTEKIKRTISYLVDIGRKNKTYFGLATISGVAGFALTGDPFKGFSASTMTGLISIQYKIKEKIKIEKIKKEYRNGIQFN